MIAGRKVILVVPGFCRASMFVASREYLEGKWTPGLIDEKWLLLNKYPLPSVEENEAALVGAAERFGYQVHDSGADLGLVGSINAFFEAHPQPAETILMSVDPDSVCLDAGFDRALSEVCAAGYPWVALGLNHTPRGDDDCTLIAGYRCYVHPQLDMTNIGVLDLDWRGTLTCPKHARYWGGTEAEAAGRLRETGKHLTYLMDYSEAYPALGQYWDPEYGDYKRDHFFNGFTGSFAEWLAR